MYSGGYPGYFRWMDMIQPYTKSTQVFNCSNDADTRNQYQYIAPQSETSESNNAVPDTYGSYVGSNVYRGNTGDWWGGAMTTNMSVVNSIVVKSLKMTALMENQRRRRLMEHGQAPRIGPDCATSLAPPIKFR